ncbi:MAG: hypothetical protein ACOCWI_03455, partial [Bacillota bacterium]
MRKRLSVIVMIIMVALALATAVTISYYEKIHEGERKVELITLDDLYIPEALDINELGLFFYDENFQRVRSTEQAVPFDNNKPLVVYIDGHPDNWGDESVRDLYNLESWQDKGYNTAIFTWKTLFSDDLFSAERKIWGTNEGMRFLNSSSSLPFLQSNDVPSHSVAEIFIAYYYDFLKSHNYQGGEIRWQGHSLGASLAVAAGGYMSELKVFDVIDSDYIPSRITLLDGLFTSQPSEVYINWLDEKVGYDGAINQSYKAIKKAKELGVAFEFIKSSDILEMFLYDLNL